jgi:hypothetical protein
VKSTYQLIRTSGDLKQVALQFIEDVQSAWGNDKEVSKVLTETRGALWSIQETLDILDAALTRIDHLHVRDRRKHLRLVKEKSEG